MLIGNHAFDALCEEVSHCRKCDRMCDSQRVLNRSAGSLEADIMFVGEAPGRLGADSSGIPFHGDRAGHNFEDLLESAQLDRSTIFVTNAVLCNPKDESGNNSPPSRTEIKNCAENLKRQIDIIDPKIVVTLGGVALESTRLVQHHELNLRDHVRTAHSWNRRLLLPFYHPGQRAMVHRSFANQRSDYKFLHDQIRNLYSHKKRKASSTYNTSVMSIAKYILTNSVDIDYFKLHKIFYLCEVKYYQKYAERLSKAYIVRQKDGPYCTDLHLHKLKKAFPELEARFRGSRINFNYNLNMFEDESDIKMEAKEVIDEVIRSYGKKSNEEIKTSVYMTTPMRTLLRMEQNSKTSVYNAPIPFNTLIK